MSSWKIQKLVLAVLLSFALALPAQNDQPTTQVGNFLFSVPNGWNPQQKGDVMYILGPGMLPGNNTFIALSAADLEGDLQNSFRTLWTGFSGSYRVLQGGQAQPLHAKKGYDAYYTNALAADQSGTQWHVFVMGAQYKKRIQIVMFMSNLPQETYGAYHQVFERWLSNLSFGDSLPGSTIPASSADASAGPVTEDKPHSLPPGLLDGFYVGGTVNGYNGRVGLQTLYFSPDGWVVKIDLNKNMIGFDLNAYRNAKDTNRSWVGRYRVEGNDINVLWQDYAEHRDLYKRNEVSAHPAFNSYVPACRCTGKHFSGKYNYGVATSGQYIRFFPDGTFLDHSVTDQMLVPNPFFDHPRSQRGTYTIQNQTLIFNFSDGHRGMQTFLAPKAQERAQTFDWIYLGIHTLYEEHYQNEP